VSAGQVPAGWGLFLVPGVSCWPKPLRIGPHHWCWLLKHSQREFVGGPEKQGWGPGRCLYHSAVTLRNVVKCSRNRNWSWSQPHDLGQQRHHQCRVKWQVLRSAARRRHRLALDYVDRRRIPGRGRVWSIWGNMFALQLSPHRQCWFGWWRSCLGFRRHVLTLKVCRLRELGWTCRRGRSACGRRHVLALQLSFFWQRLHFNCWGRCQCVRRHLLLLGLFSIRKHSYGRRRRICARRGVHALEDTPHRKQSYE
jgi:hypothetical protein